MRRVVASFMILLAVIAQAPTPAQALVFSVFQDILPVRHHQRADARCSSPAWLSSASPSSVSDALPDRSRCARRLGRMRRISFSAIAAYDEAVAELFDHIDELRKTGGRVAVATLVNTRGTTPRKEGAKMVVGEAGKVLGSVTIGGCVDAQVIEEAEDVLTTMRPRLLEMNLGDEEAWEIGLTCGGTIEVFVEPMALDQTDDTAARFYDRVRDHASRGRHRRRRHPAATSDGGKLLVLDDGTIEGTLGDPGLTERFVAEARTAIARRMPPGPLVIEGVRAFVEVVAPPALLVVVGANHVAMPLTDAGPDARLPHGRDRRPAAVCHAGALPRRRRPQDRHPLRVDHRLPARSLDRAGPGGPRLQVRPARAALRARHATSATSGCWARRGAAPRS